MSSSAVIGSGTAGACGAPPTVINSASSNVFVNGVGMAYVGSGIVPHARPKESPHGGSVTTGAGTVFVNGRPAAFVGSQISCGDVVATGSPNVNIE